MATDTTTNHNEAVNTASTIHEGDVEQAHLTQAGAPVQVQVPQGENVVRVQVTPGETVELPFPTDGLVARLGDNGNLAVKVGDVTVILVGYADATGQGDITILGNDGKSVDVAAVLASTDPNLDIQTAAGPGAGDQGTGADNNGGVFTPFDPNAGLGGLNAVGGLDPTALAYNLIQRQSVEIIEADEVDTAPTIISIKNGNPVNEDDLLVGARGNDGPQALKALEDFPSHVISDLYGKVGGWVHWGQPLDKGNDPFDTDDHEDGTKDPNLSDNNNGIDQDREPTTTTATVQVDFHVDVPGHLTFANGASVPIIDQLNALGLTSHSNELQFMLLPGKADSDPSDNIDDSYGDTIVAYYVNGSEGEGETVVVFTIAIREFDGSVNPVDFNVDFTIYGVIDNVPGITDANGDITDILDIDVPFFAVDSDGTVTPAPDGALVFQDIDDTPSLGSHCYEWSYVPPTEEGGEGSWAYIPTHFKPSDTDIIHDETPGVQGHWWNQSDEDDVNQDWYAGVRDATLTAAGLPTGHVLGMGISKVTVSFGADGAAQGNVEAGKTIFGGDSDTTYSGGFQLFLGTADAPKAGGETNWTITENDIVLKVQAEQVDANTIVGYADDGEGGRIEVFVLRIDPNTGELVIVQLHQVNHADGSNSDDASPSLLIDGQPVNFAGTDYDGDHVTSPLQVIIEDDGPKACNDYAYVNEEVDTDPSTPGTQAGVTGNLITGVSNDGIWWNNVGKDKLSVDHNHTIPQIKVGDATLTVDFATGTVKNNGDGTADDGHAVSNVQFDPSTGVLSFDTAHGHFTVVVKSPEIDNDDIPSSTDTNELGYYTYTPLPGTSSEKTHYGLEKTPTGTELPDGATNSAKITNILESFGALTLSNNQGGTDNSPNGWGFKEINAGGKTYSGIAVGGGIDGGETDTDGNSQGNNPETITIRFPQDTDAAKITVGALFNGVLYDNGNAEALKWEAWDGNTKIGEGVVYGGYDGLVSFFINTGHDFDKVTLTPLDNGAGHNGNNTDFLLVGVDTCDDLCVKDQIQYTLKDGDGDTSTATLTIDVQDGEPKITSCERDLQVTVDEDGLPQGNDNNPNAPQGDGADNVGGNGSGSEATVTGHVSYNTYTDGLGAVFLSSNSNLTTVDGKSITWAWDPANNRLVGYATPDTDRIVVEVVLENAGNSGVDFKVILHEPVDHPKNSYEDDLTINIKLTVADKDCDIDTANICVKIDDDRPTVTVQALANGTVDIDESANDQRDDQNNNNAPQSLKNVSNAGSIIEYAKDGDPVVSYNAHFGADGAANNNSVAFAVSASQPGADSGLDFKDSGGALRDIVLTTENGVVVGRVSGGPDNGKAVFAVTIDQNGELEVAQYRPIHHTNTGSNDESLSIVNGALQVTVTVTDGDGDKASSSTGIGDKVNFYDDGPSVSGNNTVVVEDDDLLGGIDGGVDDDNAPLNVTGTLAHSYGTDGAGTTLLTTANLPGGQGFTQVTSPDGKTLTISQNGTPVLQIVLSNTTSGNYTVTQLAAIKHPNGNDENNVDFTVNYQVKDNDGDTVNGSMKITVDDDTPTVNSNADVKLDDDALNGGNPNGTNDDTNAQNTSGTLSHNYGADGAGTTLLTGANLPGGQGFTQVTSPDGKTVTISQNGTPVLKVVLADNMGGNYTVTQLAPIKHPNGDNENNVEFTVTYQVKDNDGDTVNGSMKINVDDDSPVAVDDGLYVVDHFNGPAMTGNVLTNDMVGADQPGTVVGIRLGGESGAYVNVPVGGADINIKADGTSGTPAIGTLHINPNGSWTFIQTTSSTLPNLTFSYKMSDSDGDTDTASFSVDLKNAPPPSIGTQGQVLVDEDSLIGGIVNDPSAPNSDTAPGDDIGGKNSPSEGMWSDTLAGVNWQGNVGTMTLSATLGDVSQFKNLAGQAVDNITGNGTNTLTLSAGGQPLVQIQITNATTGAYTVTLLNPVKHGDSTSEDNVIGSVKVTLTNIGGSAEATLSVNIDDDRPSVSLSTQAISLEVDETNMTAADPTDKESLSGLFGAVQFGADGAAAGGGISYALTNSSGQQVTNGTPSGLFALNGTSVNLYNENGTIVGRVGPSNGIMAFVVSINASNQVVLQQLQPMKHPITSNHDDVISTTANLIYVTQTATDGDGDKSSVTSSSALGLSFRDDGPNADDDSNSVVSIGSPITGNVTNNDSSGADQAAGFPKGEVTKFTIDGNDYAANGAVHVIPGHGTMSMTSTGSYSFTQTDGSAGTMNVTYTLKDGDGDTDTATLAITTVNDLAPINYNDKDSGNENVKQDTNIMIILDVSGSMGYDIDPNTAGVQDRLTIAKAALAQLLAAYDNLGDVAVTIVTFDSNSSVQYAWGGVNGAITEINTFTPGSNTNYANALNVADDAWIAPGKIAGAQNVVYFLSDGEPNEGAPNYAVWDTFLEGNGINNVYSVAVGAGIPGNEANPDGDLLAVARPDGDNTPNGQVIYVTNADELAAELVGTITNQPISGNVLDGSHTAGSGDTGVAGNPGTPDAAGNGATYIYTFKYDGGAAFDVEFSWNGISANVTQVGAGGTDVVINGRIVKFDTEYGEMTFNFQTGAYAFAPGSVGADTDVKFHYGTKDADGDVDVGGGVDGDNAAGGADLTITVKNVVQVPTITAVDDNVGSITGNVADGGVTDDTTLVLHGKAEAGATVNVYDGANLLGTASANGSGDWTFPLGAFPSGSVHAFNATATVGATTSAHSGNYDVTIDAAAPTVIVNIVDANLNDGDTTSDVTFIFSETPVGFGIGDISVSGGTINAGSLVQDLAGDPSGKTWKATFTATDNTAGSASVSVTAGSYTDAAGNNGGGNTDTVNVDRINPTVTVNIVDSSLSDADKTSVVTFTFSEAPGASFTLADITALHGTVTNLIQNTPTSYSATFTKEDNYNGSGSVTVTNGSYTDLAGNTGSSGTDSVTITGNTAPVIGQDRIITNETGQITIQDNWLLRNDTDAQNNTLTIVGAAVGSGQSDYFDADPNHSGTSITFTLDTTNGNGGELNSDGEQTAFAYTLSDGSLTTNTPEATITWETSNSINGGNNDEILIGGSGDDTINGGGGVDVLVGGGGNDTLVFDANDHFRDGGSGFDRLQSTTSFVFDNTGSDAKMVNIEMVDLGDSNHNGDRTVTLNVADVLGTTNVTVNVNGTNHNIDLFVIGDNSNGTTDNVDLNGFTQVDVNGGSAGNGTFNYTDAVTGTSHTYTLWQSADQSVKVAVESGLDVI